jgi:hypothetical protein
LGLVEVEQGVRSPATVVVEEEEKAAEARRLAVPGST